MGGLSVCLSSSPPPPLFWPHSVALQSLAAGFQGISNKYPRMVVSCGCPSMGQCLQCHAASRARYWHGVFSGLMVGKRMCKALGPFEGPPDPPQRWPIQSGLPGNNNPEK